MSFVIRYVAPGHGHASTEPQIHERFLTFLNVNKTTGQNLLDVLLIKLRTLGLDFMNIRGQGYDNGANMKGSKSGVQAQLLENNGQAFYVPCTCHNYNLLLDDLAKMCTDAMRFLASYNTYIFCMQHQQQDGVFADTVKDISPKPLCDIRWECRVEAVSGQLFANDYSPGTIVRYKDTIVRLS